MNIRRSTRMLTAIISVVAAIGLTGVASAGAAPKGSPVSFMFIDDLTGTGGVVLPLVPTAKATVAAINANGGINGHPLNMIVCDSQLTPSGTENCARQAVTDKVAMVISYAGISGSYISILNQAGIAAIDPAETELELTSPNSFVLGPAGLGSVAGFGTTAATQNCKKLALIVAFAPAQAASNGPAAFATINSVAKKSGIDMVPLIYAPNGAPDYSPYLENAQQSGADCIAFLSLGADSVSILKSASQAHITAKLITDIAGLQMGNSAALSALGPELQKVYADDFAWPANAPGSHAGVKLFLSQMKKYNKHPSLTENDELIWMEVRLFASVASSVKTVDAASILAAMNQLQNYQPGALPSLSFNKPPASGTFAPRLLQPVIVVGHYINGKYTPQGFFNILTAKPVPFK